MPYPDHLHFQDQQAFVVWLQEEPHTDIAVLHLDPVPTVTQTPDRVTMEWGIADLDYEGPGSRLYVWRLVGLGVRAWALDGEWTREPRAYPGKYEAPTPIWLKLCALPGDLILHCESIVIDAMGWRVVGSPSGAENA